MSLLNNINNPDDLKKLPREQLPAFCDELRDFIVEQLAQNPGHLGSSLGTVELTTALHYVFDTPRDKVIWDVGHQAYAHKIITGRRDRFATNRKLGGLSGFPKMSESEYDAFGGGHTSVSISAALGMAAAGELKGTKEHVVAVIGDGAMSGGLAFEGLNNAGASNADLLVVLNDNNISIDQSVGALKGALLRMTTSPRYNNFKTRLWTFLSRSPRLRELLRGISNGVKQGLLQQSNLFESLNFRYFGPVDGHDVRQLVRVMESLKSIKGPKLLHVITVKGKGYLPAETAQQEWHAPGKFDPQTGQRAAGGGGAPLWQEVFGCTLLELARRDPRIVGITPAMPSGSSLNIMMEEMPSRCFDVGIAEGHAVTFSAGLAAAGMVPFCNIYSSFMQRAYDNVVHDVALQGLGVVFCLDRAGVVGEDGATHHGAFDIAAFRAVPGLILSAPMDAAELRRLMYTASVAGKPFMIRYPRGRVPEDTTASFRACEAGVESASEASLTRKRHPERSEGSQSEGFEKVEIGRGRVLREGTEMAILTYGHVGAAAARAIERSGRSIFHADMRFAKPLDEEILHSVGKRFTRVMTVEDGVAAGGFGSAVQEFFAAHGYNIMVERVGLPDAFVEHGTQAELRTMVGIDEEGILSRVWSVESGVWS